MRREAERKAEEDRKERLSKARWLWRISRPIDGAIAERYLRNRAIPHTLQRLGHAFPDSVRRVLCWPVFPLVPAFRSTASAAGFPALFGSFVATMAEFDFSCPYITGFGSSPSRCGPGAANRPGQA